MLQSFHDHIKGWIAGLIIGVISLTFLIGGILFYIDSPHSSSTTLVTVNDHTITEQQLRNASQALQHAYARASKQPLTDATTKQLSQYALQMLITKYILLDFAHQHGFRIGPKQSIGFIRSIPNFQEQGQFSQARYQSFLNSHALTSTAFIAQVSSDLLMTQIKQAIDNSTLVLPNEVKHMYALQHQTRSIEYAEIPSDHFTGKISTQQAIESYYQTHQAQFEVPEQVSIAYLLLSPKGYKHDEFEKIVSQLDTLIYTNPTSLAPASAALHLPIQTSPLFTRQGTKTGITAEPTVLTAIFSRDVLKEGNNSELINLEDGRTLVLRIQKHQARHAKPLEAVSTIIQQKLTQASAQVQAALFAQTLEADLQHTSWIELKQRYPFMLYRSVEHLSRGATSVPKAILTAAFALDLGGKSTTSVVLDNNNTAILHLTHIAWPDWKSVSSQDKARLASTMKQTQGNLLYAFFISSARDQAHIRYHVTPHQKTQDQ